MRYQLHHGDNRAVLKTMADNSVDSIVCDPPYELGFMGKRWDASGIAYDTTLWTECLRVLKPGGHLVAFGGTRTYHRMTVAIEDAGFEIRDSILYWGYGSGFPKSHNLDGDWKGYGTALKPAHENAVLARKPLTGTVADNVLTWGVGALNIDGSRVSVEDGDYKGIGGGSVAANHIGKPIKNDIYQGGFTRTGVDHTTGRWPANVILDEHAAEALDEQSGHSVSKATPRHNGEFKSFSKGAEYARTSHGHNDSGGASRFFYIAKASKSEREAGFNGTCTVKYNIDKSIIGGLSWNDVSTVAVQLLQRVTSDLETLKWLIDESGENIMVRYPSDSSFITSMETSRTTALKICNSLMHSLTSESTADANCEMASGSSHAKSVESLRAWILSITSGKMELAHGAVNVALTTLQQISESEPLQRNNVHSTVKPITLMRHLVRLVTPKGGVVLDPFMGSGSTGCAAMLEGMRFVGIDITAEYVDIAERRIQHWLNQNPMEL